MHELKSRFCCSLFLQSLLACIDHLSRFCARHCWCAKSFYLIAEERIQRWNADTFRAQYLQGFKEARVKIVNLPVVLFDFSSDLGQALGSWTVHEKVGVRSRFSRRENEDFDKHAKVKPASSVSSCPSRCHKILLAVRHLSTDVSHRCLTENVFDSPPKQSSRFQACNVLDLTRQQRKSCTYNVIGNVDLFQRSSW